MVFSVWEVSSKKSCESCNHVLNFLRVLYFLSRSYLVYSSGRNHHSDIGYMEICLKSIWIKIHINWYVSQNIFSFEFCFLLVRVLLIKGLWMNQSGRKHRLDIGYMRIFLTSISTKMSSESISSKTFPGSISSKRSSESISSKMSSESISSKTFPGSISSKRSLSV